MSSARGRSRGGPASPPTIHFVSLGCAKNRVDTEVMLGIARAAGYQDIREPTEASVVVVNTCGFIDPAKRESIDVILEMARLKEQGRCRCLVVAGCLAQRYPAELARELPEVDHFLGSSDMLGLARVLRRKAPRVVVGDPSGWLMSARDPRVLSSAGKGGGSSGSAYVKIGEGCDRKCAFCVIPRIRGPQRSRQPDDVLEEVRRLATVGVKEINLISQDTSAYGRDLGPVGRAPSDADPLAALVERVADVDGVAWVRLLYLYPDRLSGGLIDLLAHHPRVLPYVDMPLQHAADRMLRRMRRGHGGRRLRTLVAQLRSAVPELVFRTAFIVGHPGESADDFAELCDFVQWAEIDHIGVFRYSDEEDTLSHGMVDKVPPLVAANRYRRLMAIARRISRQKNQKLVGQVLEVLVEGPSDEHTYVLAGRHRGQAPEVDGLVYLDATERLVDLPRPGQLARMRITQAGDYDLAGEWGQATGDRC